MFNALNSYSPEIPSLQYLALQKMGSRSLDYIYINENTT